MECAHFTTAFACYRSQRTLYLEPTGRFQNTLSEKNPFSVVGNKGRIHTRVIRFCACARWGPHHRIKHGAGVVCAHLAFSLFGNKSWICTDAQSLFHPLDGTKPVTTVLQEKLRKVRPNKGTTQWPRKGVSTQILDKSLCWAITACVCYGSDFISTTMYNQ